MSKKISLLFCVALVLLFLLSSGAGARSDGSDYLGYQSDIGSCEGTALYKGKEYGIVFTPDGAGPTVEITAPESLAGYRFIGQSDGCLLKYGDFSMLCPKTELFETICSFFDLKEENFIDARIEKASGEKLTVVSFSDGITVCLSSSGELLRVENDTVRFSVTKIRPADR